MGNQAYNSADDAEVLRSDASVRRASASTDKAFSNIQSILIVILLQCFSEAPTLEVTSA